MRKCDIKELVFKVEPLFIWDCDYSAMKSYLVRKFKIEPEKVDGGFLSERVQGTATVLHFNQEPWRVVWFRKLKKNNPESLGEIAHEIFHLVVRICEDKGIAIKANSESGEVIDEPPAYLIDYFFRELYSKL